MEINKEDIKRYYKFLNHKGITELRPILPRWNNPDGKLPPSFFIKSSDELIANIERFNGAHNIYVGLNERNKEGKNDDDVSFITNIGHDIDAHGSPEKKVIAGQVAMEILNICKELGYKEPLVIDSGRGYWVIHHISPIENNEQNIAKIKEFGKKIKKKHEREGIELDSAVYNPSRIARVPGTLNVSNKDNFVMSLVMNNPSGEEDTKLKEEILAIEIPAYKPNAFAAATPSICSFMDYCLTHELPAGERHRVISRNMAIYISDHPDRELLKEQYIKIQKEPASELDQWLKGIDEKGN